MSLYRQYYTQKEWDQIIDEYGYGDPDIFPHCNQNTFHQPGTCPYCDGYYKQHPGFKPTQYETPEANGWGGNMAPILDDDLANQETAEWHKFLEEVTLGTYEVETKKRVRERWEEIRSFFRRSP